MEVYTAIMEFVFYGNDMTAEKPKRNPNETQTKPNDNPNSNKAQKTQENPKITQLKPSSTLAFNLIKRQLFIDNKQFINGCKGGRPRKARVNEKKPTETQAKPNDNPNSVTGNNISNNISISSNRDNIDSNNNKDDIIPPNISKDILPPTEEDTPELNLPETDFFKRVRNNMDCECITAAKTQCKRKATWIIYGKAYCNQHARNTIEALANNGQIVSSPPGSAPPPSPVEKRERTFRDSLAPFVSKYGEEMIRAFCDYWTERNKSGTKMRFEMEKTWDTARRLVRWDINNNKFKRDYAGNTKPIYGNKAPEEFGKGYWSDDI